MALVLTGTKLLFAAPVAAVAHRLETVMIRLIRLKSAGGTPAALFQHSIFYFFKQKP